MHNNFVFKHTLFTQQQIFLRICYENILNLIVQYHAAMELRCLLLGRKAMTILDSVIKNRRHHFANKVPHSQSYGFSSSHVGMWELDQKEGWTPKNWHFWTVGLEKTLESPLNSKEIKPVNPKGNQLWIFLERTDVEAPILWQRVYLMYTPISDAKSQLIGKDSDAGKDWGQEDKGVTENEMVGWHHPLNGHVMLCYAKSLQSCPTLCNPRDGSPPGSPVPGVLQARTLEWIAISFSNAWKWKVKVKSLSRLLATPWTAA